MNRRRIIEHAKDYMDQLAQGIDPTSQATMDTSPCLKDRSLGEGAFWLVRINSDDCDKAWRG